MIRIFCLKEVVVVAVHIQLLHFISSAVFAPHLNFYMQSDTSRWKAK